MKLLMWSYGLGGSIGTSPEPLLGATDRSGTFAKHGILEITIMTAVVLLSVLSTIDPGNTFKQATRGDLPGGLVLVAFLLILIAGWSIQGGLAHRRNG
jgi:hypothetical protein